MNETIYETLQHMKDIGGFDWKGSKRMIKSGHILDF